VTTLLAAKAFPSGMQVLPRRESNIATSTPVLQFPLNDLSTRATLRLKSQGYLNMSTNIEAAECARDTISMIGREYQAPNSCQVPVTLTMPILRSQISTHAKRNVTTQMAA